MRRESGKLDGWLLFLVLLAVPLAVYSTREIKKQVRLEQSLVRSDGVYYFVYLPSVLMDGDLRFENDYAALGLDWEEQTHLRQRTSTGHVANHWPLGTAMLWAPFYLLAHVGALSLESAGYPVAADGRGAIYQAAVLVATQVYVLLGLVLLYRLLCSWFERAVAAMAAAGILGASFLLYYSAIEGSFSHGPSFFAAVLLLGLCRSYRATPRGALLLGAALGLLAAIRPEALLLAPFVLLAAAREYLRAAPPRSTWPHAAAVLLVGAGFLVAISPQLVAWRVLYGTWWDSRLGWFFFRPWDAPLLEVLYSSRNGLLSWSPVLVPASAGLLVMLRRDPPFVLAALLGIAGHVYVNAITGDWWGGMAFGARRFATCLPLFAVGLARVLEGLVRHPRIAAAVPLACFVLHNALNVEAFRRIGHGNNQAVSFRWLAHERYRVLQSQIGSAATFPANQIVPLRYGLPPERFDELWGTVLDRDFPGSLEFEAPQHVRYLGLGWSEPARTRDGRSVCWIRDEEATLLMRFSPDARYPNRLRLMLSPFPAPCALDPECRSSPGTMPRLSLHISINGTLVHSARLSNRYGFVEVAVALREPLPWTAGLNELRLGFTGGPRRAPLPSLAALLADATRAERQGLHSEEAADFLQSFARWQRPPRAAVDYFAFGSRRASARPGLPKKEPSVEGGH
jgi:hypothetical protein